MSVQGASYTVVSTGGINFDMKTKRLDNLEVYKLALELADWIYHVVEAFPDFEKYNTIDQLRRSSTSVAANIAEGFSRHHYKENKQFCRIARASLTEVEHWVTFSRMKNYVSEEQFSEFKIKYKNISVKLSNYVSSIGPWDNQKF